MKTYFLRWFDFLFVLGCTLGNLKSSPFLNDFPGSPVPVFIENMGQVKDQNGRFRSDILFVLHQKNMAVFVTANGLYYQFFKISEQAGPTTPFPKFDTNGDNRTFETYRMDMHLVNSGTGTVVPLQSKITRISYPLEGISQLNTCAELLIKEVYPGIDWKLYFVDGHLKYDFIVHPLADPNQILIKYENAETLGLKDNGSLLLGNRLGEVTEDAPLCFQNGKKVGSKYLLKDKFVRIKIEDYDRNQTMVIDPGVVWSTYYGGTGSDYSTGVSKDKSGNVYMVGRTYSTNFIAFGGYQNNYVFDSDAYLVKFNAAGARIWATYFGRNGFEETGLSYTDDDGNTIICGSTSSQSLMAIGGYQTTFGGAMNDGFLAKFDSAGVFQWSTYVGGNGNESVANCRTDTAGNIYFCGYTNSALGLSTPGCHQANFSGGFYDGFVGKLSPSGTLNWLSYYGGAATDYAYAVVPTLNGNVYLAGTTSSSTQIASLSPSIFLQGASDGFIAKFSSSGQRYWGSYYGGNGGEELYRCEIDGFYNLYITGCTNSPGNLALNAFQNSPGGMMDAYLAKLDSNAVPIWSTYYGGSNDDFGFGCAVDSLGQIFLVGTTVSPNNIGTPNGFQSNQAGNAQDIFFSKFDNNGLRVWGSYYGGTSSDFGSHGLIANNGNLFLCGRGFSQNLAFNGFQNVNNGADAILARFCSEPLRPSPIAGNTTICPNSPAQFSVAQQAYSPSYTWQFPPGWTFTNSLNHTTIQALSSGIVTVSAFNLCGVSPARTIQVTVLTSPTISVSGGSICSGQNFTLNPSGAVTYTVLGGSSLVVSPFVNTVFHVIGTGTNGCQSIQTATALITVQPTPTVSAPGGAICEGTGFTIQPTGASIYTFSSGSPNVTPTISTTYSVFGQNFSCISPTPALVTVTVLPKPAIQINGPGLICEGDSIVISVSGPYNFIWSNGSTNSSIHVSPLISTMYTVKATDPITNCKNSDSIYVEVTSCTGVGELSNTDKIVVYPNPFSGNFYLECTEVGEMHILDLSGRFVKSIRFWSGLNRIDMSDYSKGVYLLRLKTPRQIRTFLVTKQAN